MTAVIDVRFYEELNDFLREDRRKRRFEMPADGINTLRTLLKILKVPAASVEISLVDGESVDLGHNISGGEYISFFPVFERFNIGPLLRIRPEPLRQPRFLALEELGSLALLLRRRGFDTRIGVGLTLLDAVQLSESEARILLVMQEQPMEKNTVTRMLRIREIEPQRQLSEVLKALDLCESQSNDDMESQEKSTNNRG